MFTLSREELTFINLRDFAHSHDMDAELGGDSAGHCIEIWKNDAVVATLFESDFGTYEEGEVWVSSGAFGKWETMETTEIFAELVKN